MAYDYRPVTKPERGWPSYRKWENGFTSIWDIIEDIDKRKKYYCWYYGDRIRKMDINNKPKLKRERKKKGK